MTILNHALHRGAAALSAHGADPLPGPQAGLGLRLLRGTDGPDRLVGADGELNAIVGLGGNDTLIGADRADLLVDGGGDDIVRGNGGNDVLVVGPGLDEVNGGSGSDSLKFAAGSEGVVVDLLTGFGGGAAFGDVFRSIENVVGTRFDDELFGNGARNTLIGGGGNDRIEGGAGADALFGGGGSDTLDFSGSSAGVTVNLATEAASGGDAEGDRFEGFENLLGSSFADRLTGDAGANDLAGSFGADILTGGAGADRFVYRTLGDSTAAPGGRDRILDFRGNDVLDLSALDADRDTFANEAFAFLGTGPFTGTDGELRFAEVRGNTVVLADVDGDRAADFALRLNGTVALTADDFVL